MVVEYYDPSKPPEIVADTLEIVQDTLAFGLNQIDTSITDEIPPRLLIQELVDKRISDVDAQIINMNSLSEEIKSEN